MSMSRKTMLKMKATIQLPKARSVRKTCTTHRGDKCPMKFLFFFFFMVRVGKLPALSGDSAPAPTACGLDI